MEIINLTGSYIENIGKNNDIGKYKKSFPELFEHYFTYWASKEDIFIKLSEREISEKTNLIKDEIPIIEKKLEDEGLNASKSRIILFVGQNCSNGHSFKHRGKFITWIPIEAYSTKKQVEIFITHEIIHSIHYSNVPEFYFNNLKEKNNVLRQLITEGIAIYITKEIFNLTDGETLWADYLTKDKIQEWLNECKSKEKTLFSKMLEEAKSNKQNTDLFQANNPNDIYQYRAGYYAGLKLISKIAKDNNFKILDLLNKERKWLEKTILEKLEAFPK